MAEAAATTQQKVASRVALVRLDEKEAGLIGDAFSQFRINPVRLNGDAADRLKREKFDGMVLRLTKDSEELLAQVRSAPSNKHAVIYAITSDPTMAMKYSRHGINVVLKDPIDRIAALRAVRSTYLLAIHEFRRYVRIPVAVEVMLETPKGKKTRMLSHEVSGGGMSLETEDLLNDEKMVVASFQLPEIQRLRMKAEICWRKPNSQMIGIRFGAEEKGRLEVRQWIENFLVLPDKI